MITLQIINKAATIEVNLVKKLPIVLADVKLSCETPNPKAPPSDFCNKTDSAFILRGLRNPGDFEFEKAIAHTNRKLSQIETVFLLTSSGKSYISSSIVRDVIRNGGDYTGLVPDAVRI